MNRIVSRLLFTAMLTGAGYLGASSEKAIADEIEQMRLAAHQLAGAQLPLGLLDFDIDFLLGEGKGSGETDISKTAFITRQAGAAYSLAKYLAWSNDTSLIVPLQNLIATFGALSLPLSKLSAQRWIESTHLLSTPIGRYELLATLGLLGLLYQPKGDGRLLSYERGYAAAWAGGTALALAAELEYFIATGDGRFAELRAGWLKGMQIRHVAGRGFRELPGSIEEANYANGESWLALATYAALFPADESLRILLSDLDDYFLGKYAAEPDLQFYSWGTMAAAQRFAATSDPKFADFIAAQTSHFLDLKFTTAQQSENSCALIEGFAAAASLLSKRGGQAELLQRLNNRIQDEMVKNQALQIPHDAVQLDLGSGAFFRSPRLARYAGAYLSGGGNLYARVDFTGHCLSALVEMQSISAPR